VWGIAYRHQNDRIVRDCRTFVGSDINVGQVLRTVGGGCIEMKRSNFILVLLPLHISNRNIAFCRNEHY